VPESQVERVGRYEIQAELGQGAMGVVYRAHDPQLGRTVALKTLRRDLGLPPEQYADLKKRFYQEATAAGRLNHPNLVAVHDVVELDDVPYMIMEYVEGQTLARLIATEGPLTPERAVPLIVQVCRALQYAHARGVVHRDIKPSNILVDESGQAKVSDFGIARISGSDVTQTGALLGTPAYMSPEQLNGRVVDGRSDLFSLTVALYEAVTGNNPFKADDMVAVLARIATATPAPACERNPAVSPALDAVLARGLAKHPTGRYENAQALADALAQALERPGEVAATRATPPVTPPGSRPRRRWLRAALLVGSGLVVLAIGTAAVWDWWWSQRFGSIVVNSNPAVEVFVDGEFKGRTGDGPLVLSEVAVGQRVVRLRLGPRQWESSGAVRRDEPLAVSYRFPDERPAAARAREAGRTPAGGSEPRRDAAGKIKDALDKPREAFEQFRGKIEKLLKSQ
jgi:serine/threonine protein kinase